MKRLLVVAVAALAVFSVVEGALADEAQENVEGQASAPVTSTVIPGGCSTPCVSPSVIPCPQPVVSYTTQTVWQEVKRRVCHVVPVETQVDVIECYTVPVTTKQKVSYYEQVQKAVKGKHTVYRCVPVKQKQTYYVCEPRTKKVEQTYYVCVPVKKVTKQEYIECVPVVTKEQREYSYWTCDTVAVKTTQDVVCYTPKITCYCPPTPLPSGDCGSPCAPGMPVGSGIGVTSGYGMGCGTPVPCYTPITPICNVEYVPSVTKVPCVEYRSVPKQVVQKYTVDVCSYKEVRKSQDVEYWENTTQKRSQVVDVVEYVPVQKEQVIDVMTMKPFEEEFTYYVCDYVRKEQTVDVTTYTTKQRTVKRPSITYKTVERIISEKVPVTVCVPVITYPCPQIPCSPGVVVPGPCAY